jgi:hypothetical protein
MTAQDNSRSLFVILVSRDPDAALNMAFMYAGNGLARGWWDRVRLIVWGPSAEMICGNTSVQAELPGLVEAGVELVACKACADKYGVSGTLQKFGFEVFYVGEYVTEMLRDGWKSLTV